MTWLRKRRQKAKDRRRAELLASLLTARTVTLAAFDLSRRAEETRPLLEAVDHLDVAIDTLAELVPVATLKAEAAARRPAIYVLDSFSEV